MQAPPRGAQPAGAPGALHATVWIPDDTSKQLASTPANVALIAEFERTGRLPTLGVTEGRHSNSGGTKCGKKMQRWCNGYCSRHGSQPPPELLQPGRLSVRDDLSNVSQCFLWYTNALFTRPTSGSEGLQIPRLGPGVDNKAFFVHALQDYERRLGCAANQVYPPTLELNDTALCNNFYYNNARSRCCPTPCTALQAFKPPLHVLTSSAASSAMVADAISCRF